MMLALTVILLHQNLLSRITPALIILLAKRLTKLSSAPNHKLPCLSNWDCNVANISYVVLIFVQTCLLTLTTRTLWRMSFSRNYFDHNFLKLCKIKSEILNVFTLPPLNDAGNKQPVLMRTGTDLNWDTIWISVRKSFTKTTGSNY